LVFWETPKKSYKHDHLFGIVAQEQNKWKIGLSQTLRVGIPIPNSYLWVFKSWQLSNYWHLM
jgi:hypothetical protein